MVRIVRGILWSVLFLSVFGMASCAVHKLEVVPVDTASTQPATVKSPVKAHLTDGSTVVFEKGVTVADGRVTGEGRKYDLELKNSVPVSSIAVDDVAAIESYQTPVKALPTAGLNLVATPFYLIVAVGLIVVFFW